MAGSHEGMLMGKCDGGAGRVKNIDRRTFLGGLASVVAVRTVGDVGDAEPAVRFGFITDCHYAAHIVPAAGDLREYGKGLDKMRAFAAAMRRLKPDFVVEGGDFKDLGRTPEESLVYLRDMERAFASAGLPRYHVLGNHDHDNLSKDEFLSVVGNEGQPQAKAYYAFEKNGIRFVVLDACYRPDGAAYCRGDFFWKDALLPDEQVAFLKDELASATGPVVPIVHQQLDAEDETCIRNAVEVRRILEASGKVRLVIQGHLHEGSFREVNGIGYFTGAASVLGSAAAANAYSLVEVYPSGAARIRSFNPEKETKTSWVPGAWEGGREWRAGHYQVHYIYTGRSESMFHVFPDGTTMLLDCGDTMRFYHTPAEVPLPCDPRMRAGEFAARYVLDHNPKGDRVDIFHLSHYHEDHGGGMRYHGGPAGESSQGRFNLCGIADAARFLKFGKVIDRAWPGFDDPVDALVRSRGDGTPAQVRAVYAHLAETQGTAVERFALGARLRFGALEIFNLCANGRFVRKDGSVCDLYAAHLAAGQKSVNENGMSCGFVATLGKFRYFTAGDFSDGLRDGSDVLRTEEALAEAVGPVCIAKLNHHGHHSMFPKLVAALRARVWTNCTLDRQHCTEDTMTRLADRSLYDGDRLMLPTYQPLRRAEESCGRAYLKDVARCVIDTPCHVVLDVPPGGETYSLSCYSATRAGNPLVGEFSFMS